MKKIITSTLAIWLILTVVAFATPTCHKCGNEMTEIKVEIGELYICEHCAKVPEVKITVTKKEK